MIAPMLSRPVAIRRAAADDRARVDAYAIHHDFHSRRLDRDFAELVFGTVVSSPREPSPPVTTRPST